MEKHKRYLASGCRKNQKAPKAAPFPPGLITDKKQNKKPKIGNLLLTKFPLIGNIRLFKGAKWRIIRQAARKSPAESLFPWAIK
jgi:hypothetical protein